MPAPGVSSEENDGSQAQELTKKVLAPGPGASSSDVAAVGAVASAAKTTADAVAGRFNTDGTLKDSAVPPSVVSQDSLSVISAPVVGNGTTVETATIQAALTQAEDRGAAEVVVPYVGDGVVLIDAPLVMGSYTTLRVAEGVRIKLKSGAKTNMLVNRALATVRCVADGSIAAGTKTLTSATAAFTPADVGREIVVWDAGPRNTPFFTTIASRTNATTVELAAAVTHAVTGMAVSIGDRDKGIVIEGGIWDANGHVSSVNFTDLHMIRPHHIDGLTIRGVRVEGVLEGSGISPADITDFICEDINVSSQKGQLQINGPMFNFSIRNVFGWSSDDFIAFVCSEWPGYAECQGPITDGLVDGVFPHAGTNFDAAAVKILPGSPYWIRRVIVQNVVGTTKGTPIKLGDDGAFPGTTNSKMKSIIVRNVSCRPTGNSVGISYPVVQIEAGPTGDIRDILLDGLHWEGSGPDVAHYANAVAIFNAGGVGGTINDLRIKNMVIEGSGANTIGVNVSRVTVKNLEIDGLRIPQGGAGIRGVNVVDGDSAVTNLVVRGAAATLSGGGSALVYNQAGTISRLTVSDSDVIGGEALLQVGAQGRPRTLVRMSNVRSTADRVISAASPFDADLSGVQHEGSLSVISTPFIGADGSTIFGRVRNPLGRTMLQNAGNCAVQWTRPAEVFAYSSSIASILALSPAVWVRADTLAGLADNAPVASWPDSSGNGASLVQPTGTKQPLWKAAQQNGLGAVVFDGVDDLLTTTARLPNNAVSVFAVSRLDAAGSFPDIVSYNNSEFELRYTAGARTPNFNTTATGVTGPAVALASWHQMSGVFDGAGDTIGLWTDGALAASAADLAGISPSSALGARRPRRARVVHAGRDRRGARLPHRAQHERPADDRGVPQDEVGHAMRSENLYLGLAVFCLALAAAGEASPLWVPAWLILSRLEFLVSLQDRDQNAQHAHQMRRRRAGPGRRSGPA